MGGGRSETSSVGMPSGSIHHEVEGEGEGSDHAEADTANSLQLHALRLMLLEKMIHYLPELKDVGGVRAIPIMQVGSSSTPHVVALYSQIFAKNKSFKFDRKSNSLWA